MAAAVTSSRGGVSPSSSPRLPSPPPMPELQFGPQSPLSGSANEAQADAGNKPDESARRRIRPGTKAADMVKGPPLVPLNQVDSAFPLQEHLKALYAHLTHGQNSTLTEAITRESALQISRPPQLDDGESADRNLWLYEICRFLTTKAGLVSCALMEDNPPCSSSTCPEMRASEWQYLCAVHEPPKSCCAIDYVNHTLDWAANVLTSTKHFPSRLQLGGGESGSAYQSMRQLTNIFRRVYRIFAHAWFQHREVFWHIENTHGIYMLFKTVCDEYHLIPEDNYTIPPEAEGPREESEREINPTPTEANPPPATMQILRKDTVVETPENGTDDTTATSPSKEPTPAQTARRHRHTPSTGSHVTTIAEGTEEEEEVPPVPPIPSSVSATDLESPSTSTPTVASPGRKSREALGRIDIGGGSKAPQPGHPTPTTMNVSDPLAAAGAATSDATASTTTETKTEPSQPAKLDTSAAPAAVQAKPVSERDRRGSEFESEVRSPGGGSIRTAGPDLLGAILGHMDDKEREEALATQEVVTGAKEVGSPATAVVTAVDEDEDEENDKEKGDDTVLFVGGEVQEKKHDETQEESETGQKQKENKPAATTSEEDEAADAPEALEVVDRAASEDDDKKKDEDGDEDEDDNEMMEEIKLPDRSPKPADATATAADDKGDETEEKDKDKEKSET